MKYLRRSVKYFIQITIIFSLVIGALMLAGIVSRDIDTLFVQGWKSVCWILLMFAGVSAFYPLFGYSSRTVRVSGDPEVLRPAIEDVMAVRGYTLSRTEGDALVFRLSSGAGKLFRLYEDAVTITPTLGGFSVEGLSRDIGRVVSSLEYRLNNI